MIKYPSEYINVGRDPTAFTLAEAPGAPRQTAGPGVHGQSPLPPTTWFSEVVNDARQSSEQNLRGKNPVFRPVEFSRY